MLSMKSSHFLSAVIAFTVTSDSEVNTSNTRKEKGLCFHLRGWLDLFCVAWQYFDSQLQTASSMCALP